MTEIESLRKIASIAQKIVNIYLDKPFTSATSPLEIEAVLELAEQLEALHNTQNQTEHTHNRGLIL